MKYEDFDGPVEELVRMKIKEIEGRENIRVLHVIESGSRAWGFASPDSDYDVRFIYVRDKDFYLSLRDTKDFIDWELNEVLDINGWDLKKALQHFHKSNATLFEWSNSPVVYYTTDAWKKLYDEAPYEIKNRMLLYNGSREKNTMINIHKISSNTILVGPTLNTGVDLPGDDCRFIIILKVPFPSMADKLVKEKIKLFPLWYNSATSNEIIQGIGRGVRYDGDWCVTYILDACFWQLYLSTKDQYSEDLQKRIHVI